MRLGAFQLNEPLPELKEPYALAMLQPWVDVGSVGTLTLLWLETQFATKELTRLARPGDFFDFTRYRPTSYTKEGRRQLTIPNTFVTYGQRETGHDFLFLHLLEPHSHGEKYVESILRLLDKFKVKRYCLIGSMYDLVPHTRPLLVTGSGVGKEVEKQLEKLELGASNYQGPTTIASLIPQRAQDMGIETMSLIVHLPQYTKLDDDYMGTARLMKVLSSLYDLPVDTTYIERAEQQLLQINLALDKNPQLKAIVAQLETHYDARGMRRQKEEETPRLSPEVEKFLMEMDKRFREEG
ncbi:MAG: PAC2 family protein [Dehalococcoidales bacterium]|nr:PAC2 family protein [Dehalococcoidales bacterium]